MGSDIKHVAVIMDGNRRWAKQHNKPTSEGHKAGVEALERLVKAVIREKIPYLTVFALSTENLIERQKTEISSLFSLIQIRFIKKLPILKREGVRVNFLGNLKGLPETVRKTLSATKKTLAKNKNLVLNIAINYGSREEILKAAKLVAQQNVTIEDFSQNLYTKGLPDPDLIIRTGGQIRLSNFLLWQAAYSELFFTETLWPDFSENEFKQILAYFGKRKRNFGS